MHEGLINNLHRAADKWEREHPIIGVGQLRVHDALRDAARALKEADCKIEQVTLERDAALENIRGDCVYCLHLCEDMVAPSCFDCANKGYYRWEWRGVQKEGKES